MRGKSLAVRYVQFDMRCGAQWRCESHVAQSPGEMLLRNAPCQHSVGDFLATSSDHLHTTDDTDTLASTLSHYWSSHHAA